MSDKNQKKNQMKNIVKKGAGVGICLVLAGGVAMNAMEGSYRWNQLQSVQAADNTVSLMKSEKTAEDDKEAVKAKGSLDVSQIVEQAMPSVVSISTKSVQEVQDYFGVFRQYGYAPEQREVEGSGSGIIIGKNDNELLVVTNYHVVEGATNLSVGFIDGSAYEAKVKGYDSSKDLAVVAVAREDISKDTLAEISIATIGSSDDLKVGEQVIAIGNALGYGQSVTTGIVSAKNRRADSDYIQSYDGNDSDDSANGINLIQTDAAINPGNSGGALLNMNGEVVGINSAKLASTEVEGIGYAIAISDVSDILEDLMNQTTREKVEDGKHGMIGISGSTVSQEGYQIYGIPQGVFVAEVTEGGGAEKAGIQKNSVITKFDGRTVTTINELLDRLEYYAPGEEVEVTVQVPEGNGYKEEVVTVTLGEAASTDEDQDNKDNKNDGDDQDGSDSKDSADSLFEDWIEERIPENGIEEGNGDSADSGNGFEDWQ